jgi:hypothetical protein
MPDHFPKCSSTLISRPSFTNLILLLIKVLQLLLIASIFNPFCCCNAGSFSLAATDADQKAHSCCSPTGTERPASTEHSSSPASEEDCPHQSYKSHQQVTQKDIQFEQLTPVYTPNLIAVINDFDLSTGSNAGSSAVANFPTTTQDASPPGLNQLYCVYRI